MKQTRKISGYSVALCLLTASSYADDSGVPIARIEMDASQNYVLAARTLAVSATPYNALDAALSGRQLTWTVSDSRLATVDNAGNVRGITPGLVIVTATDPDGQTQASLPVYVYPARLTVSLGTTSIEVGDSATLSTQMTDADGAPITGVPVTYSVADPGIATVAGSTLTAKAEGRTAVIASINMGPGFTAYTGSTILGVDRRADYKVTRLIASDAISTNVKLLVPYKMAAFGNYVASITSLSNGGQGLVLTRLGQTPKIIDSSGAFAGDSGKIVEWIFGLSVNAQGDVAATFYTPSEWCEQMLVVYRAADNWKPTVVKSFCGLTLQPRSMDSKGGVFYRAGNDFFHWMPDGTSTRVFSIGDSVGGLKPLSNLPDWGYTPYGNLVFLWVDNTNNTTAMAWDGASKYTKIVAVGGVITDRTVSQVQLPVEINAGEFMGRVAGSNWSALVRFKGTIATVVIANGTNGVGWIRDNYYDGIGEDIFFHADKDTGTTLFRMNGTTLTPMFAFALWREVGPVYAVSADTVVSFASTGNAPLTVRQIKGSAVTTVFGPGISVDGTAYLAIPQYAFTQRTNGASPIFRTTGGFVMKWTGSGLTTLLKPGDTLPGGRALSYIHTLTINSKGDFAFTAQTQANRTGLWAYRNGALQLLSETDTLLGSGGNITFQNVYCCERGSNYVDMNSKGQVAIVLGTSNGNYIYFFDTGAAPAKQVAQMFAASPGGGAYGYSSTLRLDENGHLGFLNNVGGKGDTLFLWNGTSVQRIFGAGDTDPLGRTIGAIRDLVTNGGDRFYLRVFPTGYAEAIYSVDSAGKADVVVLPNTVTTTGTQVSGLYGPTFASSPNGDVFYPSVTPSGSALFVHQPDGTDKVVAIASRRTVDGDWLLQSYPGAATDTGDAFFSAYFWSEGQIRFGLFHASPR